MRLIDADALKQQVESPYTEYPIMIQIRRAIKEFIDSAPTIDIVRCEECKHWWKNAETCKHKCLTVGVVCVTTFHADDFCSYGERREQ